MYKQQILVSAKRIVGGSYKIGYGRSACPGCCARRLILPSITCGTCCANKKKSAALPAHGLVYRLCGNGRYARYCRWRCTSRIGLNIVTTQKQRSSGFRIRKFKSKCSLIGQIVTVKAIINIRVAIVHPNWTGRTNNCIG